ncbi:MAG TPA: L-threonylcarbamoyladenylate synthase, partial [Candidatus Xenobia bacterium]
MMTQLTAAPEEAAAWLKRGEAVAFPTETVYGLGASVWSLAGLERIYEAKGRPADNPLIVHVSSRAQAAEVGAPNAMAEVLMEHFFPGPLTVVLTRRPVVPSRVTAGLDTVGVRMPAHATAQAFLQACDAPVAAPSANRSGRPSPTTWQAVLEDLNGRIACILEGEPSTVGLESTVVDCVHDPPLLLRPGAVSLEALQAVCPTLSVASATHFSARRSPGTRHRHYAPRARVVLVASPAQVPGGRAHAFIGLAPAPDILGYQQVVSDLAEYAQHLFAFFRACDAAGIDTIFCQTVSAGG